MTCLLREVRTDNAGTVESETARGRGDLAWTMTLLPMGTRNGGVVMVLERRERDGLPDLLAVRVRSYGRRTKKSPPFGRRAPVARNLLLQYCCTGN